jgi:hypothetical protein
MFFKKTFLKLFLCCSAMMWGAFCLGYNVSDRYKMHNQVEIIKKNTEIMKAIGGAAATNSAVTDLLLRVSHHTDRHKKGDEHFFCPECVEGKVSIAEEYFVEQDEFPPEDVPTSHEQIINDLKSIRTGVDSITFGHLNQMKSLETKLLKHRNQAKALSRVDFFGGI